MGTIIGMGGGESREEEQPVERDDGRESETVGKEKEKGTQGGEREGHISEQFISLASSAGTVAMTDAGNARSWLFARGDGKKKKERRRNGGGGGRTPSGK